MNKDQYCHKCHKLDPTQDLCEKYGVKVEKGTVLYLRCSVCLEMHPVKTEAEK